MTLFQFDELTWPEVSALSRETPLILPIGNYFELETVPALLQTVQPVGILPAIPFGWPGSGLDVPAEAFAALVRNLVGNLLEDGFTSIHVLTPQELVLEPDIPQLRLPGNWQSYRDGAQYRKHKEFINEILPKSLYPCGFYRNFRSSCISRMFIKTGFYESTNRRNQYNSCQIGIARITARICRNDWHGKFS
jgi:hypothetical protein